MDRKELTSEILKKIRGCKRCLDLLTSHCKHLQETADKVYEEGNIEQWEAYIECLAYSQELVLKRLEQLQTLRERISAIAGIKM